MFNTLLFAVFTLFHPIHISVTEVNYSAKDKALQITSRIFIDDLELAIQTKKSDTNLDILNPKNGVTTDQLLQDYLNEHLHVKVDGKIRSLRYLGYEKEDLALICYIEVENFKKAKTIEVMNTVIMETHDDQSNLVHVTYNGPIKSARLVKENPRHIFQF